MSYKDNTFSDSDGMSDIMFAFYLISIVVLIVCLNNLCIFAIIGLIFMVKAEMAKKNEEARDDNTDIREEEAKSESSRARLPRRAEEYKTDLREHDIDVSMGHPVEESPPVPVSNHFPSPMRVPAPAYRPPS